MRTRRVLVLDLATRGPQRQWFRRLMNANFASIVPQAVAAWCDQLGHEVHYVCYTGREDLLQLAQADVDVAFIGSFTQSALGAYAVSRLLNARGVVTALGGPHARCFPQDAARHFDYVLGLTGKAEVARVLDECAPRRGLGIQLAAARHPGDLPGVRARWKYLELTLAKAPLLQLVPMIASLGCPYRCAFCIDASVDHQPLEREGLIDDLRFLRARLRRPIVGWHDPNFGVRFEETMAAIEEACPEGSVRFVAESSLSLLSERNVRRLARNGFVGLLPGVESWYGYDDKSGTRRWRGAEKVARVAEQVNLLVSQVPFVQTNFVVGLDEDEGEEAFELTKRFIDLVPGAYPTFSLLTAYGHAAPANLSLQRSGRVIPMPFHFLDSNSGTNVRPLHHTWDRFYELEADLLSHAVAPRALARRFLANRGIGTRLINLIRGRSLKRAASHRQMAGLLRTDASLRAFYEGASRAVPELLRARIASGMGPLWNALPDGALDYDELALLRSTESAPPSSVSAAGAALDR